MLDNIFVFFGVFIVLIGLSLGVMLALRMAVKRDFSLEQDKKMWEGFDLSEEDLRDPESH